MRTFTLLVGLMLTSIFTVQAQAPNNGFYVNSIEKDVFKFPNSTNINETSINNRTYETYFYANATTARQFIFMEGNDKRGVLAYIENDYLIVGAYNIETNDYTNIWNGTYFRKPIVANTWYHVALVFDNLPVPNPAPAPPITENDNTAFKWYLDGVLQDEKAGFQIGGSSNHKQLMVGFRNDKLYFPTCGTWNASGLSEFCFGSTLDEGGGGDYYFDGYIWGFRVWNDARTASEIDDNKTNLILSVNTDDLLVALDGDTMTFLEDDVVTDQDSDSPPTLKEWEGNTDTNWTTATNWKNDLIPDNTKQEPVLIKKQSTFYPVINSTVTVGDIQFEYHDTEPGVITIQDGGTLDIAYDLLNDGSITIENNGALQVRESKPILGTGDVSISRDSPDYPADFYSIWSTPVSGSDSALNSIFTNDFVAFAYDSSQNPSAYVQVGGATTMEVGTGYFVRSNSTSGVITRSFSGILNNGNIDKQLYYNSPTDNANLIGNPYASAIDWKRFYEDNSNILEGTMYFWDQSIAGPNNNVGDYKSYNYGSGSAEPGVTQYIAAGLGVFVKTLQSGTVTFKNSHKVTGYNSNFYRSASNPDDGKSWFRLSGSMGYSPILIGFVPGATDGYEDNYDGLFINEGAPIEFYSLLETMKLEIQGRAELKEETVQVPLGFEVTSGGYYTVSMVMEYIDPEFEIILEDIQENVFTNLRVSDYTFDVPHPTEDHDRFILHYSYGETLSLGDVEVIDTGISATIIDNELISYSLNKEAPHFIQLFDFSGKEIIRAPYSSTLNVEELSSGVYIVKYGMNNSNFVTKKVIKK